MKQLSSGAIDKLTRYNWPGNVRQLRNVIERACVGTRSHTLEADAIDTSAEEIHPIPTALAQSDLPATHGRTINIGSNSEKLAVSKSKA